MSSNYGSSPIFVAEACEYNRSFHQLRPRIAVVLNIEEDHLDIYGDLEGVKHGFYQFIDRIEPGGALVYSANCKNTADILPLIKCDKVSFGIETDADYEARNVEFVGSTSFNLFFDKKNVAEIELPIPGIHNVANALAATAVCHGEGVPFEQIGAALSKYSGVKRRFEIRGDVDGVTLVDDYAHHPTEIEALLRGARSRFENRRIVVVFQPHQYSRTAKLLSEFSQAFEHADLIIVPDIYSVRDTAEDRKLVHSKDLVSMLSGKGKEARYIGSLEDVSSFLLGELKKEDVLITAGAGDVDRVIDMLLART